MKASASFTTFPNSDLDLYKKGAIAVLFSGMNETVIDLFNTHISQFCIGSPLTMKEMERRGIDTDHLVFNYSKSLDGVKFIIDTEKNLVIDDNQEFYY